MDLHLFNAKDSLYLNRYTHEGYGIQVTSGVTGFGLPGVDVQWLEGVGDGAIFRGRRVLPRDIDLPLLIEGQDRAHLKDLVRRLTLVLADNPTLRYTDEEGDAWIVNVQRVGGGSYVYGKDTYADNELYLTITLRAGDPYWTRERASVLAVSAAPTTDNFLGDLTRLSLVGSALTGEVVIDNTGTAPALPVWTVTGPFTSFEAASPGGSGFKFGAALGAGEWIRVDVAKGTVVDNQGRNRYADLDKAPRLWQIPPGTTTVTAQLQGASPGTLQGDEYVGRSKIEVAWRPRVWMVI